MSRVRDDTVATLTKWEAPWHDQEALRQAFLGFVAARDDACLRRCEAGHVTASAVVLDAEANHALFTLHPRVGLWLQLGGHCEDTDTGLADAALREASEESGIAGLRIDPVPLHLDVHPVTCSLGVPTRHFDVRFLVSAPPDAVEVRGGESLDLRWWPVDELPLLTDPGMGTLVELAVTRRAQGFRQS